MSVSLSDTLPPAAEATQTSPATPAITDGDTQIPVGSTAEVGEETTSSPTTTTTTTTTTQGLNRNHLTISALRVSDYFIAQKENIKQEL